MKVLKFGGTSLNNAENIGKAIKIVKDQFDTDQFIVVVSAFGGITDQLIKTAKLAVLADYDYKLELNDIKERHLSIIKNLVDQKNEDIAVDPILDLFSELNLLLDSVSHLHELTDRTMDLIMSFGERFASHIVQGGFIDQGMPAELIDSSALIKTDSTFNNALVNVEITEKNIREYFINPKKLYIAPGFIASSLSGETTTLGRGGSDYTAAIFVSALNTDKLEIWSDVDGIMTANPNLVKRAMTIKSISYAEALELAHFGSNIIFSPSLIPVINKKIPIQFKNTFNPSAEGTCICETPESFKSSPVRGVTSISNISLLTVQGSGMMGVVGIASRLFSCVSKKKVNVILITQGSSEHSITFAVTPSDSHVAKELIEKEFKLEMKLKLIEPLNVEENLAIITIVGEDMKNTPGISARLFEALGRNGISAIATAQGASELNISVVIKHENEKKALNAVHETFFLSDIKTLHVFLVGTGVIGGTLLKQIVQQKESLIKNNSIEVKMVGLANVDKYMFDEDGIKVENWETDLKQNGLPINLRDYVQKMKNLNLRNSVFVDCTGSRDLADLYADILSSSISIVTPSKIANSSPIEYYEKIHSATTRYGVRFLYETNVGAGLPIISTLKDLINSGDKIEKIEAMLSGSLNFIFSNFSNKKSFIEAVKEARAKGYTEPDPRDDLSGKDVGRKLLILSREMGMKINLEDIQITNCLTMKSQEAANLEELWKTLEQFDNPAMEKLRKAASDSGKRLKYVATIENDKATTAIKEIPTEHPFYNISGSDNIISFTTSRYKTNPLIVIGPGAGAEVTAAGVFADIIRIVNF
jgi:bifunctional aspartokinase / homoserine dehydrogenase 1